MTCTVLAENSSTSPGVQTEHGLSLLFEDNGHRFLFDCGQSDVFLRNAAKLNVSLANLDFVAISHGHYDHGGGLKFLHESGLHPRIFISPHAWQDKLSTRDGDVRHIGIPEAEMLKSTIKPLHQIEGFVVPSAGVYFLSTPSENIKVDQASCYRIQQGLQTIPDNFKDEITMVLAAKNTLTVVTGCAHQGLLNILREVQLYFPMHRIKTVMGGFHLSHQNDDDIRTLAAELKLREIEAVYPCHCTGDHAIAILADALPNKVHAIHAGSRIKLS